MESFFIVHSVYHMNKFCDKYNLEFNAVGSLTSVSLRYGYGLMDATAMVELAEKWTNVPEQHICTIQSQFVSKDKPKL